MAAHDLSSLEEQVLEQLLSTGGHGSTGDLEHRLSHRDRSKRPLVRAAWLSLVSRGLVVKGVPTSRSTEAQPVFWVSVADVKAARERLDQFPPLALGPRSRISPLAHRAARLVAA